MKKRAFSFAKYGIALCLLGWVLSRAELSRMAEHIAQMPPLSLLTALVAFTLSQWFSAARFRYYYEKAGMAMSQRYALALNYAGMFYNLLLPGGIGGDAYKVYLLKRTARFPVMPGIRIQFANRGNGLLAMVGFMLFTLLLVEAPVSFEVRLPLLMAAGLASFGLYRLIAARFLKESAQVTWEALRYSIGVQAMALAAVTALLLGMHAGGHIMEYQLLFLAAAILGLLPVTVGGLGIREATFYYGAGVLSHFSAVPIDPELGVTLSLCYFALTALSSLPGILCARWLTREGVQPADDAPRPLMTPLSQPNPAR